MVGCGQWGLNHLRIFVGHLGIDRVTVADTDPDRLARAVGTFPGLRSAPDLDTLLVDRTIDAVVIATPTATHLDLVRRALSAGKHVLCEKPLCEASRAAEELVALAAAHGRILMVGHVFLFNPGIIKLKELITSGELGGLYYLSSIRTNLGPIRNDVNAAYDLAAHDISIFNWLLDREPEDVSATGAAFLQNGIEDVVFIGLRYRDRVIANVHASWLNPKKIRQLTVVGRDKMVTWDDLELSAPVAIYDKGANAVHEYRDYGHFLRISMWEGDVRLPKIVPDEPLRAQNRFFLDAVASGRIDRSDGAFAAGVVRALEAAQTSLRRGGESITVRA